MLNMKIAYVTTYDSADIINWSGSGTFVLSALRNSGFEAIPIGNLREDYHRITRAKEILYARLFSWTYFKDRDPLVLRSFSRQVEKRLSSVDCDVIFSPGTIPISYVRTKKPLVFWTDATFAGMVNFYPAYSNLCAETIRNGNRAEQLALSRCQVAIYTSDWAADSAKKNYHVDPAKVKVIPFGANIDANRSLLDINLIAGKKNFYICRLLFVGVEWQRKGGDFAVAVADQLNKRGLKTELHVVGCIPPGKAPTFVVQHGFVSKRTADGKSLLNKLMSESHFLILPSLADCVPVVFAEASSFGLPCLASRVGGIPTAIRDGKNGQTFSLDDTPEKYCEFIEDIMSSMSKYRALAQSSFNEYSERLNWSTAGSKLASLIHEFCD
jgi:glycosyltransferase involved in cell wall biosynthesis